MIRRLLVGAALVGSVAACSYAVNDDSGQVPLTRLCTRFAPGHLPLEVLQLLAVNPASVEAVGTVNGVADDPRFGGFEIQVFAFNQAVEDIARGHTVAERQAVVDRYRSQGVAFTEHLDSECTAIWAVR